MGGWSPLAAALALMAVALAGCTANGILGAPSGGDGPLRVGATWTVRGVTHGSAFEQRAVVVDEVERLGEKAFQVEMAIDYEGSAVPHHVTTWLRASDLATLESAASHYGTLDNGIRVDDRSRSLYPDPCPDEFGKDLAAGMEWESACHATTDSLDWSSSRGYSSSSYNHTRTATYRVVGQEGVTVAAGTFSAYRVTRTSPGEDEDLVTTMWVSEQACGPSRHPVVKSDGADIHAAITMELAHHDCRADAKAPWTKGEGPRRWAPPTVETKPTGWPEAFAPSLKDLGGDFTLADTSQWDESQRQNPRLEVAQGNGYDDTGPREVYFVVYQVKDAPSDTIRVRATLYANASHAQQASQDPIHRPDYECREQPKVLLVAGAVMIEMDGDYWAADGRDNTPVVAQGIEDATAALEQRFGVEAESCDWTPRPESQPSWTTSANTGTTGP